MPLSPSIITPAILSFNEEANIRRTLNALTWAGHIVLVDSGSTDRTVEIAKEFSNVTVLTRAFDSQGSQWNYALQHVATEWVLTLDADYLLTDRLKDEIFKLPADGTVSGYYVPFQYCVLGRPLRSSLLPPRCVLFRTQMGTYTDDGHRQLIQLEGPTEHLRGCILHDDRKPLARWLQNQAAYARLESNKLCTTRWANLGLADKLRTFIVIAPFLAPLYYLIIQAGFRDGLYGLHYALQRAVAELIISLVLVEELITRRRKD